MNQRTSIRHGMSRQVLFREIIVGILLTFVIALLLSACRFYKVEKADPLNDEVVVEEAKKKDKYVILHQGDKAWPLKDKRTPFEAHVYG